MTKRTVANKALRVLCSFTLAIGCSFPFSISAFADDAQAVTTMHEEGDQDSWRYGPNAEAGNDAYSLLSSSGPYWSTSNGISSYTYNEDGQDIRVNVSGVKSLGIDVSEHQGTIDWQQVKAAGITFAIIRCGFGGTDCRDDYRWIENVQGAKAAGIAIGVYIYSYAESVAEAQSEAEHTLQALSRAGLSPSDLALPVFYDLEENGMASTSNRSLLGSMATVYCNKVQAAGYQVGIYANVNWWTNYLTDSAFNNSNWHRWVAGYYWGRNTISNLVSNADMWQFASQGTVPGISGTVDMNFRFVDTVGTSSDITPSVSDFYVTDRNDFEGTLRVYSSGVTPSGYGYDIRIPVWPANTTDGSTIKFYQAQRDASGNYYVDVPASDYGNYRGTYCADCYAVVNGQMVKVAGTLTVNLGNASAVTSGPTETGAITTTITGSPADLQGVRYAIWSSGSGQSDLQWVNATRVNSHWSYTLDYDSLSAGGTHHLDAYAVLTDGSLVRMTQGTFEVSSARASVSIQNYNKDSQTYQVVVSNLTSAYGVSRVTIPTWSQPDQSDIVWYTANRQSDGTYVANVKTNGQGGTTYVSHAYVVDNNGDYLKLGEVSQKLSSNQSVSAWIENSAVVMQASGVNAIASEVRFAVWSNNNGQDDLVWLTGSKVGGNWMSVDALSTHGYDAGTYQVHTYAVVGGYLEFVGATQVEVASPSATVSISNYNAVAKTYQVVVSNVDSPCGVSQVVVPTWSKSDQSDIVWYTAQRQSDGSYVANIQAKGMASATYTSHAYVVGGNGTYYAVGAVSQKVTSDIQVSSWVEDEIAMMKVAGLGNFGGSVRFACWSEKNGQDDLVWLSGTLIGSDWMAADALATHNNDTGNYQIHAYAEQGGTMTFLGSFTLTVSSATCTISATCTDSATGAFAITVSNLRSSGVVTKVQIPTWSADNGQSDLVWYDAIRQANGTYTVNSSIAKHQCHQGTYISDVYVTLSDGTQYCAGRAIFTVNAADNAVLLSTGEYSRSVYLLNPTANAAGYVFPTWSATGDQDDLTWVKGVQRDSRTWVATYPTSNLSHGGAVVTDVYATDANGNATGSRLGHLSYSVAESEILRGYPIMGPTHTTVNQMVKRYQNAGWTYPAEDLSKGGAATIQEFCTILYEEATAEGVNAEVVFAQAMHETGWLQYDPANEQFNFCGLGASGNGAKGYSFSSVREGIRAQVQLLKGFASTEPLVNPEVRSFYNSVSHGSAPSIQDLVGKWATDSEYGNRLQSQIDSLLNV